VKGLDDLRVIDPLEVDRCDPEIGVSQLPLDDDERDTFVRHLNRMGVAELVWCEPTSDPSCGGGAGELSTRGCWFPVAPGGRSVDHAEERADRQRRQASAWVELLLIPTSE